MKRSLAAALAVLCLGPLFSFGSRDQKPAPTEPAAALRIVSLVPSATETLFALQAQDMVVARSDFCTWPPEAASIPSAGGFDGKAVSLEKILSFRPGLVCLARTMHDHLVGPLEALEIEVFVCDARSIQHVQDEILMLGALTGKMDETILLLDTISRQLEWAKELAQAHGSAGSPRTAYWEVAASPFFTAGRDSFLTDLLAAVGLENVFAQIPQSYPQVAEESIVARQPDIIFFPDYGHQGQQAAQAIARRTGWQNLPAVANGKIFPVESNLFSRPGPRIGEMALQLVSLTYNIPLQGETAP